MLPGIGPAVTGASWTPYDGHANSLNLLHALHRGFTARGGTYLPNRTVDRRRRRAARFPPRHRRRRDRRAEGRARRRARQRQAGAAVRAVSAPVGRSAARSSSPSAPARVFDMPTTTVRQTLEGGIMIGDSMEDVGFDTGQRPEVMQAMAKRAVLSFPWLAELQIVRAWAALRVMPPDGTPIYDESEQIPRRLHRQLPQRRDPRRRARQCLRADGRRRRARPDDGAVLGQALRCSASGLTSRAATVAGRGRGPRRSASPKAPRPPPRCCSPGCQHPRDPGRRRPARALLPDGRVLRLPRRDRRRPQPAKLHGDGRAPACASAASTASAGR